MTTKKKTPPEALLTLPKKDELIRKAIDLLKEGDSPAYVTKKLTTGKLTEKEANDIVNDAITVIREEHLYKPAEVKALHILRYNKQTEELMKFVELDESLIGLPVSKGGITRKSWLASRERKIRAYDDCMRGMQQLENLYGLMANVISVEFNSNLEINGKPIDSSKYDLSKLSLDELIRLNQLIEKSKVDHTESGGVIEVVSEEGQVTEDIVAEILPANVELIQQITPPPDSESKPQEKSSADILQKLKERLAAVAAKKFGSIGGHLDQKEKELLNN